MYVYFCRNNPKALYILGEKSGQIKEIGHSNTDKDLGVMIVENVKWKNHINHVVNKANKILKRTFESKKLELVQRRTLKLPEGFKNLSYNERLGRLNLTSLKDRPIRWDLIGMFKVQMWLLQSELASS